MKPAILHLRASNFVGGPEKQIFAYANCCSDELNTIIASFCGPVEGTDFLREATSRGINSLELSCSLTQSIRSVVNCVRQSQVRLLCAHGYKGALVAGITSAITGVPYACFLRGSTRENLKVVVYEAIERFCCRGADRIVCLSHAQGAGLSRQYKDRVRVVVNATEVRNYSSDERIAAKQRICNLAGLDPEQPLVVAAGRLSPEKGAAILVDAAAKLSNLEPSLQFVVFGDGIERGRITQRICDQGLGSSFKLVGHQPDFSELVCGADLLVNPSFTEEMPNVVLEAMSAGVPIVATAVGGVPELASGDAIALVPPGNALALSNAILDLAGKPEKRESMIKKAWARLSEDYSPARQRDQLRSLYEEYVALRKHTLPASQPRMSVIIPVRNEEKSIASVIEAFRGQDYPSESFEIIVADGLSTDRTPEIVHEYALKGGPKVRLVKNAGRLSSCGRNAGVAAALGEIILFSDGHCYVPSSTLLRDVADLFDRTRAGILCRPQPLDYPSNSRFQKLVALARASWLGHGRDSTIYSMDFEGWVDPSSAGAIYQRSLFEQFGGFDETFDACEDVEFNHRLYRGGVRAYISPKLTVLYEPRKTLVALFKQMMRYGKGRVRLARKHSGSWSISQFVPAALVLLLISAPLGFVTRFWSLWLSVLSAYFLVILADSLRILRRVGIGGLLLPVVLITIHTGLGTGLIFEWLGGNRRSPARVPSFCKSGEGSPEYREIPNGASAPQEIGTT